MTIEEMVEKFQCPGCVCGSDVKCGKFRLAFGGCDGWVAGTRILPIIGKIALGLPKGFNHFGPLERMSIRCVLKGKPPTTYNKFNVPVWAMEQDGFFFVKVYSPRTNYVCIDVYEDKKDAEVGAGTVDVGAFIDEID